MKEALKKRRDKPSYVRVEWKGSYLVPTGTHDELYKWLIETVGSRTFAYENGQHKKCTRKQSYKPLSRIVCLYRDGEMRAASEQSRQDKMGFPPDFISYPTVRDYNVIDSLRPIPDDLSEALTASLFTSAVDLGKDIYLQYGRKRTQRSANHDATVTIDKAEKCMDRKVHYCAEYVPFENRIPHRAPMFLESKIPAIAKKIETVQRNQHRAGLECAPNRAVVNGVLTNVGGSWGETIGESQVWHGNKKAKPTWLDQKVWKRLKLRPTIVKPLPAAFAETVMLPLSKMIGWKGKGQNAVKYAKH